MDIGMDDRRSDGVQLPDRFQVIDVSTTTIEEEAPEPLVSSPVTIYRGQFVTVYGHPGSLKTFLVLYMAVQVALSGKMVLWLAGEGSRNALLRRIESIVRGLGTGRCELNGNFRLVHSAFDLLDPAIDRALEKWTKRLRPTLVVVDPMASFYAGEENNASAMRPFIAQLHAWIEVDIAVVLIHHSRKSSETASADLRGSSALRAAMDSVFVVTRPSPTEPRAKITHEKARDEAPQPSREVHFEFVGDCRVIVSTVRENEPSANGKASPETLLLETLAKADEAQTRQQLRESLKWSGERLKAVLTAQVQSGKLEVVKTRRQDRSGRVRELEAYRAAATDHRDASDGRSPD